MKARLIDVATQLNISATAVSLAINNKPGVSEETRKKVLEKCNEIGYKVPDAAGGVNYSKTVKLCIYKKHGLVISDTPFFSALLEGIGQKAANHGVNVMYSYLSENVNSREAIAEMFQQPDAGGMIVLATEMDPADLELLEKCSVPLVLLDAYFPYSKTDTVVIDNVEATKEIVEYLIACGHRKIGHIKSRIQINNFREREDGLKKALYGAGLSLDEMHEYCIGSTPESAYSDMLKLLEKKRELPTAFFADNDLIAIGAIRALKHFGIKVPEDVSVVGFDDVPNGALMHPALTTVRVMKKNMGCLAVERLIKKMAEENSEESDEFVTIRLGTEIIERDSVKVIGQD